MPNMLWGLMPRWFQIYLDYEGAKLEILKALNGLRTGIRIPEIAAASSFGAEWDGPLYPHVRRLVSEGFVRQTEEPRNEDTDRVRRGRPRYKYMLSPEGVRELRRLTHV